MELNQEMKKKRKGISVSLTPDKSNSLAQANSRPLSPINNFVNPLQQSFAINDQHLPQKYVRVFPIQHPNVHFTYGNQIPRHRIRQGIQYSQVRQQYFRPSLYEEPILINRYEPPKQEKTKLTSFQIKNIDEVKNETQKANLQRLKQIKVNSTVESYAQYSEVKPDVAKVSLEREKPVERIQNFQKTNKIEVNSNAAKSQIQIKETKFEVKAKPIQKRSFSIQKNNEMNFVVMATKNPERQKKVETKPIQIELNANNKQNQKQKAQRMKKLQLAQQKLLQIIRICDNNP